MNALYDGNKGPRAFEIDVNEGFYPNILNITVHGNTGGTTSDSVKHLSTKHVAEEDLSEDFHTYGVEWNEKELIFYFDGKEIDRKPALNAQLPVTPIISSAVLNWAGPISDDADGKSMDVDWIRVYKKK